MAHEVNPSHQGLAGQVREALRRSLGAERFDLWITPDTQWQIQHRTLSLEFATEFASQLCRKMLASEISQALQTILPDDGWQVQFKFRQASAPPPTSCSAATERAESVAVPSDFNQPNPLLCGKDLEPRAAEPLPVSDLFQNIVLGESNQMACAAVRLASSEPGRLSPLVLHGPSGCGKSMLLSAIAHRLRSELRMRRVVYMTSEQFTNDFTEGLRGGGLPMFRRKYRDVEALLLDDLQFFAGKKSTVAEVRHTIDNLIRNKKLVVVAMDRPLPELSQLGEELVGRLRGGLVAPLFPLDAAIRQTLLKRLTEQAGIGLEKGVLEHLSERIAGDGRLIRGVVHRLTAVASLQPQPLTWDRCWSAVFDLVQASQPIVRLADIEKAVCGMFGLEQDSLQSQSKMRSISQPRMLAMFLARKYTPAAYKEIGDYFGRRRHSTVISAEKTVEIWLRENAKLDGPRHLTARDAVRHVTAQLQVG